MYTLEYHFYNTYRQASRIVQPQRTFSPTADPKENVVATNNDAASFLKLSFMIAVARLYTLTDREPMQMNQQHEWNEWTSAERV